jgi:c-di-GMP-binding flagellar brake protein YcgR
MQDDRRQFMRFDIPLDVEFKRQEDSVYSAGVTINFSRAGLCLESSDTAPSERAIIDLKVKLPADDSVVQALGDVMWKRPLNDKCLYGVKLMSMDRAAKSLILDTAFDIWTEKMRTKTASGKTDDQ